MWASIKNLSKVGYERDFSGPPSVMRRPQNGLTGFLNKILERILSTSNESSFLCFGFQNCAEKSFSKPDFLCLFVVAHHIHTNAQSFQNIGSALMAKNEIRMNFSERTKS